MKLASDVQSASEGAVSDGVIQRGTSSPETLLRPEIRAGVSLSWSRVQKISFSVIDQGFAVGGMFLANIALARTQSKEEYGIFTLTYSFFTFLSGLHNASILEAYTIYGSGRYSKHLPSYSRLLWRNNVLLCLALTAALAALWGALARIAPTLASRTTLGMALACGVLLTASFVRRTFYMRGRPDLAARFSSIFFVTCAVLLWLSLRFTKLTGFYAFAIVASAWLVAALFLIRELPGGPSQQPSFLEIEPGYWAEHWKYSRWVFVTALVFQFLTQGYYWLAAGILSVREAGELRALNNLVMPLDQLFTALVLLVLPLLSFRFASSGLSGLMNLWKKYSLGWLAVSGGFAASVLVFGTPAMHILYAGKFDDVAPLLAAVALLPVIMGIGNTINAALKAMEKPQAVFYAYAASGAATILVGFPIVVRWGLWGTVYGMLLSSGIYTAVLASAFVAYSRANRLAVVPEHLREECRSMEVAGKLAKANARVNGEQN